MESVKWVNRNYAKGFHRNYSELTLNMTENWVFFSSKLSKTSHKPIVNLSFSIKFFVFSYEKKSLILFTVCLVIKPGSAHKQKRVDIHTQRNS